MKAAKAILWKLRPAIYLFPILMFTASAAYSENIGSALINGKPAVDIRIRYENVNQENSLLDADSLTIRTRVGYGTSEFHNIKLYAEIENVVDILDDYNSTKNGNTQYSVVADPDETEVNQAYVLYNGLPDTEFKLGRQRLKLNNDRFIGNVGWRQLEQTYDAVFIKNSSIPDTVVSYIYINGIKNIFSYNIDLDAYILNLSYSGWSIGTLTGYGYFLDFNDAPATSQETFGLRFMGSRSINDIEILYTGEYAKQDNFEGGSNSIDSDYLLLEIGAIVKPLTVKLGYEKLGGDSFSGFETPLATKHAFNGWADQFLGTPSNGLKDVYLSIGSTIKGIGLRAVYHNFKSDIMSIDYGTEWNLLATKKFDNHFSGGLKYADYNAENFKVDAEKIWLWMQAKF